MNQDLNSRGRTAIWFAYLSPLIGIPLIGPWIVHALLDDDSTARPYVARAFDLHLVTVVAGISLMLVGFLFEPEIAEIGIGALMIIGIGLNFMLLFGALKGSRWANPWEPVVLGRRMFYKSEPYIGEL